VTRKWLFLKRKWEHDPKAEWELRNGRCVRRILLPSVFPSHETRGTGLPSVLLGWKWGQKTEVFHSMLSWTWYSCFFLVFY
jgi:hypothetical protein